MGNLFMETRWSIVSRAQGDSLQALGDLFTSYRRPLLVWCRSRGEPEASAEDLVQGFLARLLQSRGLRSVGREKGRFRTFLLVAFKNYLRDEQRRSSAAKRGGGCPDASLDAWEADGWAAGSLVDPVVSPDQAYDRAWADAVLANALRALHEECASVGRALLAHRLEGVLFEDPTAPTYAEVALEFGMNEGAVKMATHRLRKRLRSLIREELMRTLEDETHWREELLHLRGLFTTRGPFG